MTAAGHFTDSGVSPHVLNAGEPVLAGHAGDVVTLVEGSTFCLSGRAGDIHPGGAQGLFVRDARALSRWELRLDGQQPEPLTELAPEAFAGRFVLRRPPQAGQADSTLLVVRERLVGDGLRETVTLENLGREATTAVVMIVVEADFADLFAVKEGRATGSGGAHATATRHELVLHAKAGTSRAVRVTASREPLVTPGVLSWRVVVPARGCWTAEIVVEAMVDGRWITPPFEHGQQVESTAAARKLRQWRQSSTRITAQEPLLGAVLRRTETDLGALRVDDPATGTSYVAAGAPWFMTLFGRDSLLTSWMVLPLDPSLAVGTLRALAATQGRQVDPGTEEEPGRILHELRRGPDSGLALGGNHYYGSIDSTPLFVMLLAECWRWGVDEDTIRELLPAADAALDWIERHGARHPEGFLAYRRATDRGLENQGWKDSFDGISFTDGRHPETPLALCEVQGYVYAAWLGRAELADALGEPEVAARCRERAAHVRETFLRRYWLPEKGWYALALDREGRHVDALASNVAHCLWTGIATDEHAASIVERLAAEEMDTGYGLRTLSSAMGAYNPMSYHNGSVWPHDTAIAVAGLLRYAHVPGAVDLAHRLMDGLLDAAAAFDGRLPELFCGFDRRHFAPPVPYPTSCSPQAWATAAPLLLLRAGLGLTPDVPRRCVSVQPHLPERWSSVALSDLRLGPAVVHIEAAGTRATVRGLPGDWTWVGAPERSTRAWSVVNQAGPERGDGALPEVPSPRETAHD